MPRPQRSTGTPGHSRMLAGSILPADARPVPGVVGLREVRCPDCEAEVGQPCIGANGRVLSGGHASRRRMANRARNARLEAEPPAEPSTVVAIVQTTLLGIRSWHAECQNCGWSCLDRHDRHHREVAAVKHAEGHACP